MKKLLSIAALGSLLAALVLAAAPAWAGSTDERIKALEEELVRLKTEQMELKKDAVAAAAALPTFSYRPGSGMTIAAADKSWSMNLSWTLNTYMYNHPNGKPVITRGVTADGSLDRDNTGMTSGQFFLRRNRPEFTFCWADCFYEAELSMDMGEGETVANARDNRVNFHFEQWNPFLPTLTVGTRIPGAVYIGRSSSSGFKDEHNLLVAGNSTTSTGSSSGINLFWEEVPVATGDASLFVGYRDRGIGFILGDRRDTDRKGANLSLKVRPFRQTKNQWLRGLEMMVGTYLQPIDKRADSVNEEGDEDSAGDTITESDSEEPNRLRIRSNDRIGRITLFDANGIGSGLHYYLPVSGRWVVGPYSFRWAWSVDKWRGGDDAFAGVGGTDLELENGVWLWSPKGLFTGSSTTANSLQLGWTYERVDVGSGRGTDASPGSGSFHQNTIKNRELFVGYFIRPALRAIFWWNWQEADNTPRRTQVAIGCKENIAAAGTGKAQSRTCDWHSVNLGLQYRF